jgi:hypothetical protein
VQPNSCSIFELSTKNSGIDGPNGWVPNNRVFDKEYFDEVSWSFIFFSFSTCQSAER